MRLGPGSGALLAWKMSTAVNAPRAGHQVSVNSFRHHGHSRTHCIQWAAGWGIISYLSFESLYQRQPARASRRLLAFTLPIQAYSHGARFLGVECLTPIRFLSSRERSSITTDTDDRVDQMVSIVWSAVVTNHGWAVHAIAWPHRAGSRII